MARDPDDPRIEITDDGAEVMSAGGVETARSGAAVALAEGGTPDPEQNPAVAETRRIRAGEVVVKAALPFGQDSMARRAPGLGGLASGAPAPPAAAERGGGPEVPEAVTEAVRPDRVERQPLPFQTALQPAKSGPTAEEVDDIVWGSKVGIDPKDLPSAQLVVPPSAPGAQLERGSGFGQRATLGVLVLVAALVVGFAITALIMAL